MCPHISVPGGSADGSEEKFTWQGPAWAALVRGRPWRECRNSGDMLLSCLQVLLVFLQITDISDKAGVNLCTNCLEVMKCHRMMR